MAQPSSAPSSVSKEEESKLVDAGISIRNQLASGDQDGFYVIELPNGKMSLSSTEADAFRAAYTGENSFRGNLAAVLVDLACLCARLQTLLNEFKQVQNSTYLWQPKAESLKYLLPRSQQSLERAETVLAIARQRGLTEKIAVLSESCGRVTQLVEDARAAVARHS